MQKQFDKFMGILKEMFQMDQAELDFGIYRIMNAKRAEIEKYLTEDLKPQVYAEFEKYRGTAVEGKKKELEEMKKSAMKLGHDPETEQSVLKLKEDIAKYGDDEALANDVFSHLASFFRRYYDNGDFISLRRYKKDTYAIPYEGEEVKLHWANADQYYIKTTEYLKDYTFKLPSGQRVHFKLVDATQEKDNNKTDTSKERKFMLSDDEPVKIENEELYIQFVYLAEKERQDKHNKATIEKLSGDLSKKLKGFQDLFAKAPTEKNENRTMLEKHLNSYTARFNFDFFIHKDLGGFLNRELDFYLKNEVIYIDDLDAQDEQKLKSEVAKAKVIKHIGTKIIIFLVQLEEFQKKMWLKKKFVIDCGYCITLDRVPEELYHEIVKNKEQIEEWVRLYAIDEIKGDLTTPGYSKKMSVEFLKANKFLILDTKFYDYVFLNRLLLKLEQIDEQCKGLLINSDNLQATSFLKNKYYNKFDSIYIDPPYNTDASSIIYKNDYKDSSWMSLMHDRLKNSKILMSDKTGIICVAIDDEEVMPLKYLLRQIFNKEIGIAAVRSNPAGRKTKGRLAPAHEYAMFYSQAEGIDPSSLPKTQDALDRYPKTDDKGRYAWANFIRSGSNDKREDRPKLFYPIVVSDADKIRIPKIEWNTSKGAYDILEKIGKEETIVYPIVEKDNIKIEKNWHRGHIRVMTELDEYRIRRTENGKISIDFKTRMDEESLPITWWDDSKYASANYGASELKALFGEKGFDFAKSRALVEDCLITTGAYSRNNSFVIDFFAGSGTTGHAILSLQRDRKIENTYVLVEMGDYFNAIVKPRIMKAIYTNNWDNGKPLNREGISHMFKYMRLESYDDTLDNLVPVRTEGQQKALDLAHKDAQEEYKLKYMLNFETKGSVLNIDKFTDPFNYTINIRKDDELKPCKVDLVETFNYLIGLWVDKIDTIKGFHVITGKLRTGEKTLVIWRNTKEKTKKDLDDFFMKQKYNTLDMEFDLIFVNGDNNLENLRVDENKWKVKLIEEEFVKRMFETEGI